jgi:glutathione S-transferase
MRFYYNPQSRAVIAKWMLDECSVTPKIVPVDLQQREHKTSEYLKVNPTGKVPTLVDGDAIIFENAAICLYLGDKYPEANLAPPIGDPRRGRYLTLMVYSTSQIEPAMSDALLGIATPPERGWTSFATVKEVVDGELGDGCYLFGDWFTAADVMIGSMFIWLRARGQRATDRIEAYVDRLQQRPHAPRLG